eukprot:Phypoly_transcript_03284.p1 GENE.Phypoly_transcript_03284~~Phypoly_transcript_03284.p1  ORF type:complete len:744 (+),score=94.14 Phypoly_transcript_03284:148-2379(+)
MSIEPAGSSPELSRANQDKDKLLSPQDDERGIAIHLGDETGNELQEFKKVTSPNKSEKKTNEKQRWSLHQRFESLSEQTRQGIQNQAKGFQMYMQRRSENKMTFGAWLRRVKNQIEFDPRNFTLIYLVLLGLASASVGFLMDMSIDQLQRAHYALTYISSNVGLQYLLWQAFVFGLTLFALAFTKYISIFAAGSGIPEMKSILSGSNNLNQYLSIRTLVAKIVGLVSLVGCGIVVGKEGPFVHVSSIIAVYLAKLPPFKAIKNNLALKQQMLAAACGAGVASNFGAPVGGVLFSIEVTSTYYPVRNYYYVFLAATSGGLLFRLFWGLYSNDHLRSADTIPTNFSNSVNFLPLEFLFFIAIGVVGGILGIFFVKVNMLIFKLKSAYNTHPTLGKYFQNSVLYTVVLCIFTGIFTFPGFFGDFMGLGATKALRDLVSADTFRNNTSPIAQQWEQGNVVSNLFTFFTIKFFLCLFSISLPIPLGLYTPLLMLGAGMGRFVGESLAYSGYFSNIIVGGYAVVGAAAMAAGATQTLSTMVIIFEVTGQLTHIAPVMLATMVAYFISKKFTVSIYDAILLYRGLPYLPDLKHINYTQTARELMKDVKWLALDVKYSFAALRAFSQDDTCAALGILPLVASEENGHIVGYIEIKALELALARQEHETSSSPTLSLFLSGPHKLCIDFGTPTVEHFDIHFPSILVTENTPFTEIHMLFINLRLQFVLVTNNSKLVGVVTRDGMLGILLENV